MFLGEAEYVNDIPKMNGELAGAFVLTTVGNARLKSVDASEALVSILANYTCCSAKLL